MNDSISRQVAVNTIKRYKHRLDGKGQTYGFLLEEFEHQIPSTEAEWIPCSERLPERDELVLVTYKTTDKIHLCKYIDDGSENPWWSYIDDCCAWNNVVLAWMPLPNPYREDGEV